MSDYICEEGGQVAYIKRDRIKGDRAFDLHHNRERYRVEGSKLLDLTSGKIMGYLDMLGRPSTASKSGLFDSADLGSGNDSTMRSAT
jgi:hypothetical protein